MNIAVSEAYSPTFAYFYMSLMLGHAAGHNSGGEINTRGGGGTNVMMSFLGATLVIGAPRLPWPILLMRKAVAGAEALSSEPLSLWSRAVEVVLTEGQQEREKDEVSASWGGPQAEADILGHAIENAQ